MKFIVLILCFAPFLSQAENSSSMENCEYATQDTHTVSESSYYRLLAQLTRQSNERKRQQKKKSGQTGRR